MEAYEAPRAQAEWRGDHGRYRDGRYRTIESWSCERSGGGQGQSGCPASVATTPDSSSPTSPTDTIGARALYEDLYCARGDMENRIKEQQLDLFADRTSAHTMRANQLRAYLSAFAGVVIQIIRMFGLKATRLARAQAGTIRTRLLKIARIRQGDDVERSGSRSPRSTRGANSSNGSLATSQPPSEQLHSAPA